jgi:hypothetical protein
MTNWDLYKTANYIIGKYPSGNAFNSDEFEELFNYCQILYLKKLIGLPEEYQPMNPTQTKGYGITSLLNFIPQEFVVTKGFNVSSPFAFNNGTALIPNNFFHWIGMTTLNQDGDHVFMSIVELVSRAEYDTRRASLLKAPSIDYPIASMGNGNIYINPISIKSANFDYIRYPNDIVVATTINSTTGEEEYNAGGSTESEWTDVANYDILAIMLQKIGVNIRSVDVINYGLQTEQKGT